MAIRALEDSQLLPPEGTTLTPAQAREADRLVPKFTSWARVVRGGVLAGAFYVERNLDVAIEAFFLGKEAGQGQKADIFAEAILPTFNFERRIQVGLSVAEALSYSDRASLGRDLREVKAIRNAMAHHPVWFETTLGGEQIITLRAFIAIGKQTRALDEESVQGFNSLIARTIDATKRLADLAIGEHPGSGDAEGDQKF